MEQLPKKNYTSYICFTNNEEKMSNCDDKNENIDEWEEAGGMGILYPRPWNRLADHPYPLEYLVGML